MDQILQDRQNMKIMEKFVLQLQQEMKSTKQELMSLKQGNGHLQNQEISQLRNESMTLKQTVTKLQNELAQVKTDNNVLNVNNKQLFMKLQNEISACNNKTLKTSEELDKFTHSTAADQLKNATELNANVNSLNKKTDTINVMINSLTSSSKARGQDFLALLNKTITAEKKIVALVTESNKVSSELNHLSYNQNSTIQKIDEAFHKISDINQTGINYSF
jgi:chromosome segregation ATPase